MRRRRAARKNPLDDTQKWLLIGSGIVVVGGVAVYLATRPSSTTPAPAATATSASPTLPSAVAPAYPPGAPGSQTNPLQITGSLLGPQGAYATREVGGQIQTGQFLTPVNVPSLGITEYKFVPETSTPAPPVTGADVAANQAVAQAQSSAAQAAAQAAAANAWQSQPQPQATLAPSGVTYAITLDHDQSVELNVGQTLGIRFPASSCGSTWGIQSTAVGTATNPDGEPVSTPAYNIIKATAVGTATVMYTCETIRYSVTIGVNAPGQVVLGP